MDEIRDAIDAFKAERENIKEYVKTSLGTPDYSYEDYKRRVEKADKLEKKLQTLLKKKGGVGENTYELVRSLNDDELRIFYIK